MTYKQPNIFYIDLLVYTHDVKARQEGWLLWSIKSPYKLLASEIKFGFLKINLK